jgi:DNA-binding GntR family transcriptional regulator
MVTLAERRLTDAEEPRRLADDVALAVKRKDGRAYIEADRAFHCALVSRANNPLLTKMIMDLRSVKEHYQLIDLAIAGDTAGIADLITAHIMSWEPVFTAALTERLVGSAVQSRGR